MFTINAYAQLNVNVHNIKITLLANVEEPEDEEEDVNQRVAFESRAFLLKTTMSRAWPF